MIPQLHELFDTTGFAHADLLAHTQTPWELLDRIAQECNNPPQGMTKATAEQYPGAIIGEQVYVGANVRIEPGATVKGPALIGDDTEIRSQAYIREHVIVGKGCIIGKATELKNVILLNGVMAAHHNYIGDSVIGNNVHFGAGAVCANLKQTGHTIAIVDREGREYDTGRTKVGAFIGDDTEIGANAVTNPGTIIGKRSSIYPLALIRGSIPADSIVKVRQQMEVVQKKKLE